MFEIDEIRTVLFSIFFLRRKKVNIQWHHYSCNRNIENYPDLEDSVSPSQNEIISGMNKIEFPCLDASRIASASESSVVRVDDE